MQEVYPQVYILPREMAEMQEEYPQVYTLPREMAEMQHEVYPEEFSLAFEWVQLVASAH